jgi:hypothetical protein
MKIGDLVKYKRRYTGQFFVVIDIKPYRKRRNSSERQIQCMRLTDGFKTRYSNARTVEVINESR